MPISPLTIIKILLSPEAYRGCNLCPAILDPLTIMLSPLSIIKARGEWVGI